MQFNKLIPELSVTSIEASKKFYIDALGFKVEYERIEDKFVFVSKEGSQIMIEELNGHWQTGEVERPFGRGINFQLKVADPESLANALKARGILLFRPLTKTIYRTSAGDVEQVEFLVQDPDGYLLRFAK